MKVVGFNGSPRKKGNTAGSLNTVFGELEKAGIETELIQVGNRKVRGCIACYKCVENRDEKCAIGDDPVNDWIRKMKGADGILLGSPVYFSGVAGTMKSFLDRAFFVSSVNGGLLRHKVGAAVAAVRRSGVRGGPDPRDRGRGGEPFQARAPGGSRSPRCRSDRSGRD